MELFIIIGIALALLFNFVNGLNDAANAIATVVTTRVLSPVKAVGMAAFFNLVGPLFFTTAIAATIGEGIVDPGMITPPLILAAMVGAVLWVFFTSWLGIPISSSHALIGGMLGAGIAVVGVGSILWPDPGTVLYSLEMGVAGALLCGAGLALVAQVKGEAWWKYFKLGTMAGVSIVYPLLVALGIIHISGILAVLIFMIVSPTLGFVVSFLVGALIIRLTRDKNPPLMNLIFRRLQLFSASFYAIGHGSNDAQNAMGIITALLVAGGALTEFSVPLWVILTSCGAISLGTFLGGWRVVETMGKKITRLQPYQGFCAETSGGVVLSFVTSFGIPVSTTHAISGSIMGVGATRGYTAVKWGIVREIVTAWIITIPASAAVAWLAYVGTAAVLGF